MERTLHYNHILLGPELPYATNSDLALNKVKENMLKHIDNHYSQSSTCKSIDHI